MVHILNRINKESAMANTYSQIYIQVIFAVKGRANLIREKHHEELYKYITGLIKHRKQKLICINGMPDHVHLFIGLNPDVALSDLIRDVKRYSTIFINEKKWMPGRFYWQEGFAAFSYSHSHIDQVFKYIQNQKEHHKRVLFRDEYVRLLKKFNIDYNEKYLFQWVAK
jgi:putative transposase